MKDLYIAIRSYNHRFFDYRNALLKSNVKKNVI